MPASERRFSGRLFCLVFWSRQWMQAWMVSLIHFVRQILVAIFCPTTNPTSAYSQERWPITLLLQARTPLFFMPKKAAVLRSCKSALVCSVVVAFNHTHAIVLRKWCSSLSLRNIPTLPRKVCFFNIAADLTTNMRTPTSKHGRSFVNTL